MSNLATSRPAKVGDMLETTGNAKPNAFAIVGKRDEAICLLPGTELVFDKDIQYYDRFSAFRFCIGFKTARYRRFGGHDPNDTEDAIELPDGRTVMIAELAAGQTATVVQVPPSALSASPK